MSTQIERINQPMGSKRKRSELPKVIYRKLGRTKPKIERYGYSRTSYGEWVRGKVYIDPRQDADEMLDTLVHELLHESR